MKTQKNNVKTENEKWYDHFTEKKSSKISAEKSKRKEFNKSRDKYFDEKRRGIDKKIKFWKLKKIVLRAKILKKSMQKLKNNQICSIFLSFQKML